MEKEEENTYYSYIFNRVAMSHFVAVAPPEVLALLIVSGGKPCWAVARAITAHIRMKPNGADLGYLVREALIPYSRRSINGTGYFEHHTGRIEAMIRLRCTWSQKLHAIFLASFERRI